MYENKEHKKMYKVGKRWTVMMIAAASFVGATMLTEPQGIKADAVSTTLVGNTSQDLKNFDSNALTDTQQNAIQARDNASAAAKKAQVSADAAESAVSTAQDNVNSTSAAKYLAQSAYNQATKQATGVTQGQKDKDVASAQAAVNAAQVTQQSAQTAVDKAVTAQSAMQANVDRAQDVVDTAQSSTVTSGGVTQTQKNADVAKAQSQVASAQAAVDAITKASQSQAAQSNDLFVVQAKSEVSAAQDNLNSAQAQLSRTPATNTQTIVDGTIGDGQTYSYVTKNNKWNSNVTDENYNGDVNDHVTVFTQAQLNSMDNGDMNQSSPEYEYYSPKVGTEYNTDAVVNKKLTAAQQLEVNSYALMLVNKYREALGYSDLTSNNTVYNATQNRGVTLESDPDGMVHNQNSINSAFSGLSWSGECLSGTTLDDTSDNIPMADVLNQVAEMVNGLLNQDANNFNASDNYGHRNILLGTGASTPTTSGAFSLNYNQPTNRWILVFDGISDTDDSSSALIDTTTADVPTSHKVTIPNPNYATAQAAVKTAQKQLADANAHVTSVVNQLADHYEAVNGYDQNVALETAQKTLADAQSEVVTPDIASTDLSGAKAELTKAQNALSVANNNVATAKQALTDANADFVAKKSELTAAQNEVVNSNSHADVAKQALNDANTNLANAKKDLQTAQDQALKTKQTLTEANKALATAQQVVDDLLNASTGSNESSGEHAETGSTTNKGGQAGASVNVENSTTNSTKTKDANTPVTIEDSKNNTDGQSSNVSKDTGNTSDKQATKQAGLTITESNSKVSVLGTETDKNAKTTTGQSKTSFADKTQVSNQAKNNTTASRLPQTGSQHEGGIAVLGIMMAMFGIGGITISRKRES